MLSLKKILSTLLVLALVLTLAPISPAKAFGQGSLELGESIVVDMPHENATTPIGSGPSLASGNHEKWIDRIANVPAYGSTFYTWLENNASGTGILADPTKGTLRNDTYIYQLTTIEASADYTYTSSETPADAAKAAATNHGNQAFAVVMDYAVEIYSAFHRDHPEVFWLSGQSSYNWSMSYNYNYANGSGTVTYTMRVFFNLKSSSFDIRDSAYRTTAAISAGIAQRDGDVAEILADCPTDSSVYEQLRYLNKTLTETNVYNSTASESVSRMPWQCLSALAGEDAAYGPVCEGYAKAFKVLCDKLDIPCTLVEGDARSSKSEIAGPHMWNYVQVDGGWYAVDVTWNDPLSGSNDGIVSGYESEEWFLLGSDSQIGTTFSFLDSHPVTNVVTTGGMDFSNGPVLEQDAYTPGSNYMDIAPYRSAGGYTAPEKEGMIFAGWYLDAAMTKPLSKDAVTGYADAKFVDANTLSLKYQLSADVSAEKTTTDLRLLTGVESLNLSGIWFEVNFNGNNLNLNCTKVYSQILVNGQLSGTASRYFGSDADYFAAFIITGIPQAAFDSPFAVTPTWKTLDGTVVSGTQRTFTISGSL